MVPGRTGRREADAGATDIAAPTVEHVYVLADALDGMEVYECRQPPREERRDRTP
jgi:hypothetical protein